uniref:Uncharacterized protein n=1 Tax=Cajanus cajan TaxID=3821 RepID=A0A151R3D2_CAJCA|nr:hypothetical protein KK1_041834 [Cajanus cajan]
MKSASNLMIFFIFVFECSNGSNLIPQSCMEASKNSPNVRSTCEDQFKDKKGEKSPLTKENRHCFQLNVISLPFIKKIIYIFCLFKTFKFNFIFLYFFVTFYFFFIYRCITFNS